MFTMVICMVRWLVPHMCLCTIVVFNVDDDSNSWSWVDVHLSMDTTTKCFFFLPWCTYYIAYTCSDAQSDVTNDELSNLFMKS